MDEKPFSEWQATEARRAIAEAYRRTDPISGHSNSPRSFNARLMAEETLRSRLAGEALGVEANRLYYLGDHWQAGAGWTGPRPKTSDVGYHDVMSEIEAAFTSKNTIAETIDRHRDAVIGSEPYWTITPRRPLKKDEQPTAEEQRLIEESEALLADWWTAREALSLFQDCVATLLWAGRSYLRLIVPEAEIQNGIVPKAGLAESINRIYIDSPDIAQAAVAIDPRSMRKAGVYLYQAQEGETRGEMTYLDDAGNTVLRALGDGATTILTAIPLGGRLMIHELNRKLFTTAQIREQQALQNLGLTMLSRNVVLGGFLERIILNAQLPGEYVDDPEKPGQLKFVPGDLATGAGTTNAFAGIPIHDEAGNVKGYTTPSVVYRDPVATDTFENTIGRAYQSILEETNQLHAMIARDATASGESRIQATAEFARSLRRTRSAVNSAGCWLLETALALAANFAGAPGRFDSLRVNFTANINLGPMPAEQTDGVIKKKEAGLISIETAQSEIGIDDPKAEREKIASEKADMADQEAEIFRKNPELMPGYAAQNEEAAKKPAGQEGRQDGSTE